MQTRSAWLALGLALMAPVSIIAQPAPDATLESLVTNALANNPDIRAAEEALQAARERPAQATALPDPMVSTVLTNEGWTPNLGTMPDSNLAVMGSQAFPPRGDRALRGRIAARDVAVAEQQLARTRRTVEAAVRRSYFGLAQARALLAVVAEQDDVWKQIEGVARARYSVGQGAQQDVLRVQVELTRIGQLRIEQQSEEQVRTAELNRLLGRPAPGSITSDPLAPPSAPAEGLDSVLGRLVGTSPEVAAARAAVDKARLGVDLAKVQFKPGFSVQAAYMNRGGLDPMWQAGVGVTLPLRKGWRKAGLAEAEARVRAAESLLLSAELELRLRSQERLVQIASAQQLWTLYDQGIVPQDQMAVEAALASYRTGQVPFITVLESLATLYGDRSTQVRLAASHARARVSLEEASLAPTNDLAAAGGSMASGMGAAGGFGTTGMGAGAASTSGAEASSGAMNAMSGR